MEETSVGEISKAPPLDNAWPSTSSVDLGPLRGGPRTERGFLGVRSVSNSVTGEVYGPEAIKESKGWLRSAFPDTRMTIEDQVGH